MEAQQIASYYQKVASYDFDYGNQNSSLPKKQQSESPLERLTGMENQIKELVNTQNEILNTMKSVLSVMQDQKL